jgi:hypothetical protein
LESPNSRKIYVGRWWKERENKIYNRAALPNEKFPVLMAYLTFTLRSVMYINVDTLMAWGYKKYYKRKMNVKLLMTHSSTLLYYHFRMSKTHFNSCSSAVWFLAIKKALGCIFKKVL